MKNVLLYNVGSTVYHNVNVYGLQPGQCVLLPEGEAKNISVDFPERVKIVDDEKIVAVAEGMKQVYSPFNPQDVNAEVVAHKVETVETPVENRTPLVVEEVKTAVEAPKAETEKTGEESKD